MQGPAQVPGGVEQHHPAAHLRGGLVCDASGGGRVERTPAVKGQIGERHGAILAPATDNRPQGMNGPRPSWVRTGTTSGLTSDRRCQFAPSTTRVWPVTKRA